ncbi:MAG: hypothetical protein JRN54_02375 [Nitrososphaerota archaeon]|nr:hypothetical protein [Nitrososphaerota archaeon]MDG7016020.1 hypothetical protein [Nitrososphaerota archaeon]
MTLRFSRTQKDIIAFLKVPGTSPEKYADLHGIALSTVLVQLARARHKDRDARVFHATYNGLMGANPNLRQWLKVQEPAYPVPLTQGERSEVDRRLQDLVVRQVPVARRPRKGKRRNHASTGHQTRKGTERRNVKRR